MTATSGNGTAQTKARHMNAAQLAAYAAAQTACAAGAGGFPTAACTPYEGPAIPMGPDGCPQGEKQCLQPLAVTSPAIVVSGTTVVFPITPRDKATARSFLIGGAAGDWLINQINVNGQDYLNGSIIGDRYLPLVEDRAVTWGKEFSSNTPMTISVTKLSVGDAVFRGVLDCTVNINT